MKLAYFDCFSGISGDMVLGALTGLGVPFEWLEGQLALLPVKDYSLSLDRISRHGIQAVQIGVHVEESHHHRTFRTIRDLIADCPFSDWVKAKSLAVFERIAVAEGAVHGIDMEDVHFHEVGSVDAIVDIVGACLCFEYLKIDRVVASPLPLGKGFVRCAHGVLPVPAPATLEIVKGVPVYTGDVEQEMVTPTGAAIIVEMADAFDSMPSLRVDGVGYGAGTREIEQRPNLLRVVLGRSDEMDSHGMVRKLTVVETNIDDMNPEVFGYLMEALLEMGARDVFWTPIYMKKNRPGTMIQVLCDPDLRDGVVDCILAETTSIGVRYYEVQRTCLHREAVTVETRWGAVAAKRVVGEDGAGRTIPEYDACRRVARDKGVALRDVYQAVLLAAAGAEAE